jgi:predicted metal-dependent hydrolase
LAVTPVEIVPRDVKFPLAGVDLDHWHPAGRHVSLYFHAMSVFFPEGEKFFIRSVRHFEDRIHDPKLNEEVRAFIGQEAKHGREHRDYNRVLVQAGYPADRLEQGVINRLKLAVKFLPPYHQLAMTIALEHFTAIMANVLLDDKRTLAGADSRLSALWHWHAIEETEHKAVAFDVYQAVAPKGLRGYLIRALTMLQVSLFFAIEIWHHVFVFARARGALWDLRGWGKLWYFLWIAPGGMRRIILPWASYFVPGFHPWQHDNRHHVEEWRLHYDATGLPPP